MNYLELVKQIKLLFVVDKENVFALLAMYDLDTVKLLESVLSNTKTDLFWGKNDQIHTLIKTFIEEIQVELKV